MRVRVPPRAPYIPNSHVTFVTLNTAALSYMLDENEFLAPQGIRSLSRIYGERPYILEAGGHRYEVAYSRRESPTGLFGGNSNWRGPIWFPLNYLLIEALERYDHFYGDSLKVQYPTGSGRMLRLGEVAAELSGRLSVGATPMNRSSSHSVATSPTWFAKYSCVGRANSASLSVLLIPKKRW